MILPPGPEGPKPFDLIKAEIRRLGWGEVSSYGEIARAAGFPRGARTVTWVLKTCSEKDGLPWHRVVNKDRRIAIKNPDGHHLQRQLLEAEGWSVGEDGRLVRPEAPPRAPRT